MVRLRRAPVHLLLALVLALSATALLGGTPADAAGKKTQTYATTGLRASLTVDFRSKYEWTVAGWVQDVCPADGKGVYMEDPDGLRKAKGGGWRVVVGWFGQGSDTNGCGNGKTTISNRRMYQSGKNKTAFEALRIKVCARNGSHDPTPRCYVRVWYNPYY